MNNFQKQLLELKKLNLPLGQFAIFGSGPMAMKGLRDSNDIDLILTKDLFDEFKQKEDWEFKEFEREGRQVQMLEKNEIELYPNWGPGEWDPEKLIKESEVLDGLPFVQLKEVVKWKKISGREKDINDIKLIEGYLNARDD